MDRIAANKRTYNLLSDILKIAGEYHPKEIQNTLNHVSLTSKGDYHDIMATLLKNFELLNNLPEVLSRQPDMASDELSQKSDITPPKSDKKSQKSDKTPPKSDKKSQKKDSVPSPAKTKPVQEDDPKVKELRAMLEDSDFISSKKDAVKIIEDHFKGAVTLRPDNKDSKRDVISKIVSAYKKMQSDEKQKNYSALKRSYLKSKK